MTIELDICMACGIINEADMVSEFCPRKYVPYIFLAFLYEITLQFTSYTILIHFIVLVNT